MRKLAVLAVALGATCPDVVLAQVDPNWSQREMERMQAEQERFNAQVERQRAEQERFNSQVERQRAEQERWDAQVARQRIELERGVAGQNGGGSGCALCNIISIFDGFSKKRHSKAAGQMLAAGDCAGAEKYALSKGDLDLASYVEDYCQRQAAHGARETIPVSWLKIEADSDGTVYFVDRQSIRPVGDRYAWLMYVLYPRASNMREMSVLSYYRCSDRRNAVKSFASYFRDGDVQLHTVEDRHLKFEPLTLKTPTEKALVDQVCSGG